MTKTPRLRPRARRCPICGKPAVDEHRPFCSRRCADVDLHRWLSGSYVIPASEETPSRNDEERDEPPPPHERH